MKLPKYFISCDWGTSNFRLRVIETNSLDVLAEFASDQGIKTLYEKFQSGESDIEFQKEFFCNFLERSLEMLPAEHQKHLVVISGMASSNIGLYELEYAELPLKVSGKGLQWKNLSFRKGQEILLISGVKSASGMMRGEEIQAVGLEEPLSKYEAGTLILPGTHSKHLTYRAGSFTDLKSFMTGEIFDVLFKNSILSNSICRSKWKYSREEAFKKGLYIGFAKEVSSNLFSIRAQYLNGNITKEDNYYLLSGMLIGDELAYLKKTEEKVFLLASNPLYFLYKNALEEIIKPTHLVSFDKNTVEETLIAGQKKLLNYYATN